MGSSATDDVVSDFTALGDAVNTTARLASEAARGELIISLDAAKAAGIDSPAMAHRTIAVRGRAAPVEVAVLHVSAEFAEPA